MTFHRNRYYFSFPQVAQSSSLWFCVPSLVYWCLAACFFILVIALNSGCNRSSEIAGPIDTTDFVIPAGETVTATAETIITATNKIEIDGTLYVAPGANVTFKSPSVNINGTVQNLSTYVSWWRRTQFTMRRLPDLVTARIDRLLGRQPRYLNRGPLDCFSPASRTASPKP